MQWIVDFEIARIKILASNGLKACIGNFAVGTPDVTNPSIIEALYPAISAAIQNGGILGLHEYAAPWLNATFSGNPQSGEGWLTGRYRMLYNNYLIPNNLTIPLVITELGIDGGTCAITGCDICAYFFFAFL